MKIKELEEIRKQILEILKKKLNIDRCLLVLYGSTAKGEDTNLSDIDIAIDCLEAIEDGLFLELLEELNLYVDTPKKIELVEIRRLSEEFLENILTGAVLWHVGKDYLKSWINQRKL